MKIINIELTNIKCFDHVNITLHPYLNIITGVNGSGKSALLEVILSDIQGKQYGNILKEGCKSGYIMIEVSSEDLIITIGDKIKDNNFAHPINQSLANNLIQVAKTSKHDLSYNLFQGNFWKLKRIVNQIFLSSGYPVIELTDYKDQFIFKTQTESGISFDDLPDGHQIIFSIALSLLKHGERNDLEFEKISAVALIDNIDCNLHPSWQRTIINSLHKSFPEIQFIFTGNSPYIIQSMPKSGVFQIKNDTGKVTICPMEIEGEPVGNEIQGIHDALCIPDISAQLNELMNYFDTAVATRNKEEVNRLYEQIRNIIPDDSSVHSYLETMGASLL